MELRDGKHAPFGYWIAGWKARAPARAPRLGCVLFWGRRAALEKSRRANGFRR